MGFNAMQPGRIKKADLWFLVAAVVVIAALLIWVLAG
jgi:hypothetical protein